MVYCITITKKLCRCWKRIEFTTNFSSKPLWKKSITLNTSMGCLFNSLKDSRLNPTHISLYVALFQLWNYSFFKGEFYINREEVMAYSKIGSKSTYHRCIKELSHWNYLLYTPSHNPFKGSRIKMFDFGTSTEQVLYPSRTNIETSNGQALVSINKHIQTIENNKNLNKRQNFNNSSF